MFVPSLVEILVIVHKVFLSVSLPYVKELEEFNNNFIKKYRTKVIYSAKNKLNNINKLGKYKNDKSNNANVVYKINCNDCKASYVE